ncbi:MAG: carbamoyltransferase C-terminal domain-containing protein, partial [Candidatus Izemoplasmatales bacterium]|nr:carbamoyltransferase C-terminal domain-containing protein [Candidatus Izemoplasmatales bacterium]
SDKRWYKLFGFKRRDIKEEIEQRHCNLALAIQKVTEEIVIKMATEAKRITNSDYLCMAGGVALNAVANGKLLREKIFMDIYIQPAAGDAGGALGAALAANFMYFDEKRIINSHIDSMCGTYLGPCFSEKEINRMNKNVSAVYERYADFNKLSEFIAGKVAEGHVIGWFQGRMEFGPRALGNRSIIADPRNPDMQKALNIRIKNREGFRPFAPSVILEDVSDYFELNETSPYMLIVAPVKEERRNALPNGYHELPLWEKLYFTRSDIQSVTHIDFTARIQTVSKVMNPRFWQLINEFKRKTGYGLVINTSFNVRGEPIVCTPHDAYRCFMTTDINYLVIENFVYCKTEQTDWENKSKWSLKFNED